jgi:lipopolysaccharide export system permease protein
MNTLTRYLSREFIQNFFLCLGAFTTIYLIVEFFERINAFLYNRAPLSLMAPYFLNKIPAIVSQVAPAAILLATIVTLGLMSRHNEIMAMKSGGISLWRILSPILGVVLIIYFALLGLNEWVTPAANQKAREVRDLIVHKKKPMAAFKQSQIWIHSHQAIYNIRLYHPEQDLLEGFTVFRFGPAFQLAERIDARSARWKDGKWTFAEASVTAFPPDGFPVRKFHEEFVLSLPEMPADFRIADKPPEEMNYSELQEFVRKIERDGYRSSKYRTAMHHFFSFPFIGVILAFLGVPIALRKERGAGIAVGIGLCLFISFVFFVVYSFSIGYGQAGTLPPFLAAWLGNIIFAMVGVYFFLSIRH